MTRPHTQIIAIIAVSSGFWACARGPARPPEASPAPKPAVATAKLGNQSIRAARPPSALVLGLSTGQHDDQGRPIRVACQTCHQKIVGANADVYRARRGNFHAAIQLRHGRKTCKTCHRGPHFADFNLADGTPIAFGEVMRLCGQCHSRRLLEYQNGAHGGMTGFWDTRAGPRQRNHCLDCHDAHHPAIDQVQPAPRARNRRLR